MFDFYESLSLAPALTISLRPPFLLFLDSAKEAQREIFAHETIKMLSSVNNYNLTLDMRL